MITKLFKHTHKWQIIKTRFPYNIGYGVICKKCKALLEHGLSEAQAREIIENENKKGE